MESIRYVDATKVPKRPQRGQCVVMEVDSPGRLLIGRFHDLEAAAPFFGLTEKRCDS